MYLCVTFSMLINILRFYFIFLSTLKFIISLENAGDSLRLVPWSASGHSSYCLKTTTMKYTHCALFYFKSENNVSLIIEYSQRSKKKTRSLAFEINEFYSYLIKSPFNSNNVTIPLPSAMGATKIICELDCKE